MTKADEEFMTRLRATFKVEAEEHLQAISTTLLELEKSPAPLLQSSAIEGVYREAHSLKGAARAVDFIGLEAICQAIEGVFASWKREMTSPSPDSLNALHSALDMIHNLLESPDQQSKANESRPRDELIRRLSQLERPAPVSSRPAQVTPKPVPEVIDNSSSRVPPTSALPGPATKQNNPPPPEIVSNPSADPEKPVVSQTVRIAIEKLDARLLQAEDMLAVKSLTAERARELREINTRFSRWQHEWAKVSVDARAFRQAMQHNKSQASVANGSSSDNVIGFLEWNAEYIRSLENKLQSLAAQAELDRHGVAKRVDDLLEDSKKLLMLPFSTLAGIFPKVVRDLSRDQAKEAELVIQGGDLEIDKRILEEIKDALMHILRNSVDHGIELPAQRQQLGKQARAQITISVSAVSGNKVEILVTDDGSGVDIHRVKESAVQHGIISYSQGRSLTDAEALDLVFHSEVSTSPAVTKISGRGLGMAIARAKCEKLGGRISIESTPNVGTAIRMLLPLTMATFRGVLIGVGDHVFAIPTVNIERVVRVNIRDVQTVENRQVISVQGRAVSLVRLDSLLGLLVKSSTTVDPTSLNIVLLHSADQRVGFVVDQVLREEEVMVKPLRKPLVRVRNIAGVTVLGSGKTVPVLNVSDLMISARGQGVAPMPAPEKPAKAPTKKILVAEDSITSRMLLKGILEGAGFLVRTAVDGMDAFTALREDKIDLVVSDVEMPRLNGFDLTIRIRSDKRTADLPVVLVSALESREQRERGIDAGASAYIVKSSFDQSDLLAAVQRLV